VAPELRTLIYGDRAAAGSRLAIGRIGRQIAGNSPTEHPDSRLIAPATGTLIGRHTAPGVRIRRRSGPTSGGKSSPGPQCGHLHLPNKTGEAFTQDGWFRTGDLGFIDKNGCLQLAGRASSRITLPGGEKIWPERVEDLLDDAPSIREAGVLA
jgi:long-chain acyl-CoA synthetase